MADAKISALTAAGTLTDTDVLPLVNGGISTKATLNQLTTYFESRARQNNASIAQQTFSGSDAYVVGSDVLIPTGRLQAKTMYRCRMELQKTSTAGTAAPIVTVRIGTAASTADTSRAALTFGVQTAVADAGFLEVFVTFRAVGASGIIQAVGMIDHQNATTGLQTTNVGMARTTSSTFDTTTANTRIGFSFNGGSSFTGTSQMVQAELMNLA